jgi:hypothetical protein
MVVRFLNENGFPGAFATTSSAPGRDVYGVEGVSIEVKARAHLDLRAWLRQTLKNTKPGELPLLVVRNNGQGEGDIENWAAIMPLGVMVRLIREVMDGRKRVLEMRETEATE